MTTNLVRTYTDIHGNTRVAVHIRDLTRVVPYLDGYSATQLWLIDGQQLQIPVAAWGSITYEDSTEIHERHLDATS